MEGLYYPYSENKGADQLRSYCAADLRLCFRKCKKPVFSKRDSVDLLLYVHGNELNLNNLLVKRQNYTPSPRAVTGGNKSPAEVMLRRQSSHSQPIKRF